MANLTYARGRWMNLDKPGGAVFFVGGGTPAFKGIGRSNSYSGLTPEEPLSTIAQGVTNCVDGRGDTIVLLPGSVTVTTAIAMSKADVTLSGVEPNGSINPSAILVNASAIDGINVSAANVVIEDLHFPAGTTAANTSRINAGAAGLTVRNCTFECGAYDLESITIPSAGLHTHILNNRFYITANGPDAAIEIEAAAAYYINIVGNVFHGGNDTNGWDTGAINSGVAHLDCVVKGNTSTFGPAIIFSAAAKGMISDNDMGEGTLGSMLDPGSCMCTRNFEADAIDQKAREFPTTAAS
jgi:hypothetical protein